MGKVAVTYKLMPENPEVSIERVRDAIPGVVPEGITINTIQTKPLAFGLRVVEVTFLMDDKEGLVDRLEEALHSIGGIQNVDVVSVSLI